MAGIRDGGVTPIGLLPLLQRIHDQLDHGQACSASDLAGALTSARSSDELIRTIVERSCILDSGAARIVLRRRYAHLSSSSLAYTLESAAEETIRRREVGVRRSRCTYQLQAETLHRTWGREGRTTALLVSQGQRRRSFPDVYLFGSDAPRLKSTHRAMTPPALLQAFDEVIAALR